MSGAEGLTESRKARLDAAMAELAELKAALTTPGSARMLESDRAKIIAEVSADGFRTAIEPGLSEHEHAVIEQAAAALPMPYLTETDELCGVVMVTARPSVLAQCSDGPAFTFARRGPRVMFAVLWIDGSSFVTWEATSVETVAGLMASGLFVATCARLGLDVPPEDSATAH